MPSNLIQASTVLGSRLLVSNFDGDKHVGECFVCGRGLTSKAIDRAWYVEMTTSCELIPNGTTREDSQGCFPLGATCARRVPRSHRFKLKGESHAK